MHIVYGQHEFKADIMVIFLGKDARFILANIVTVEAVLERERVSDGELLPSDDTRSAYLVWLHTEATVLVVEHVTLLSKDTGQKPDDGPTQESSIGCGIATVEKRIFLL